MDEGTKKPADHWRELPEKDRRRVKNLLLALALGVALLSLVRLWPAEGAEEKAAEQPAAVSAAVSEDLLQRELEAILSQVKGAGRVRVAVWYSAGSAAVYATESEDSSERRTDGEGEQLSEGRRVSVATVGDQPLLVRQEAAAVRGVVVVAEGAGDPQVRERLYAAVKSLLGLKTSQIAVIEGEGSDVL